VIEEPIHTYDDAEFTEGEIKERLEVSTARRRRE
jgi:hypothetical protein